VGDAPAAVEYPAALLARLARLCEEDLGRERCGFVVREDGALRAEPIANVAEGRDAFLMDVLEQLRLQKRLRERGGEVVAVWHSHLDAPAALSAGDRDGAARDGLETSPGAEQLVASVRAGRVMELRRWRFRDGRFEEVPLLPAWEGPARSS
jgi:proteasome lid subunit RPN8/RPN11